MSITPLIVKNLIHFEIAYNKELIDAMKLSGLFKFDPRNKSWFTHWSNYNHAEEFFKTQNIELNKNLDIKLKIENLAHEIIEIDKNLDTLLSNLTCDKKQYQIDAVRFMNTVRFGGILKMDVGLGKTIIAMSLINAFKKYYGKCKSLVLTKSKVKPQFVDKVVKFSGLDCCYITGNASKREKLYQDHEVIVSNYEITLRDKDMLLKSGINWDVFVGDEIHRIKSIDSKTNQTLMELISDVRLGRYGMSANPIEKNYLEAYGVMNVLNPFIFHSQEKFKEDYCIYEKVKRGRGKEWVEFRGYKNVEHLLDKLSPFFFVRSVEDVQEQLPELVKIFEECEMVEEERKGYDAIKEQLQDEVEEIEMERLPKEIRDRKIEMKIKGVVNKLRRYCVLPKIYDENIKSMTKVDTLFEILNDVEDRKILIFSEWTDTLDEVVKRMKEGTFVYYNGSLTDKKADKEFRRFKDDEKVKYFVSTNSGRDGIDLENGSLVILLEDGQNPYDAIQKTGRARRIGSKHETVRLIHILMKNSIEEYVLAKNITEYDYVNMISGDFKPESVNEMLKVILKY